MKILAPFSSKEEVSPMIDAGADELYCGIIPPRWHKRYSALEILSRRGGFESNFSSFADLKEAIAISHSKKVPVFVALNVPYVTEQYPFILKIVNKLCQIGVDAFIVADIGLLLLLKDSKIKKEIHISTLGNVFNSKTVKFYKKLGVKRIVLPRHLTLAEMNELIKQSQCCNIEFEAFILNTLCHNIDGLCHFFHNIILQPKDSVNSLDNIQIRHTYLTALRGSGCEIKFSRQLFNAKTKKIISNKPINFGDMREGKKKYSYACGICQVPEMEKSGIKYLKIVERGRSAKEKLKFVQLLRRSLDLLKKEIKIDEYRIRAKKIYQEVFNEDCSKAACYYL